MAVKEKMEPITTISADSEVEWNVENELQLYQVLCGNKPIGISRFFQMACIVEKLANNLNKEVTSKRVWDHLSTMFDLQKLNTQEEIPFPNDETEFMLPKSEFGDLMAVKLEADVKKPIKKEETKVKVEKTEPSQPSDKKGAKRTRASASNPGTPTTTVTPKRRRI